MKRKQGSAGRQREDRARGRGRLSLAGKGVRDLLTFIKDTFEVGYLSYVRSG